MHFVSVKHPQGFSLPSCAQDFLHVNIVAYWGGQQPCEGAGQSAEGAQADAGAAASCERRRADAKRTLKQTPTPRRRTARLLPCPLRRQQRWRRRQAARAAAAAARCSRRRTQAARGVGAADGGGRCKAGAPWQRAWGELVEGQQMWGCLQTCAFATDLSQLISAACEGAKQVYVLACKVYLLPVYQHGACIGAAAALCAGSRNALHANT